MNTKNLKRKTINDMHFNNTIKTLQDKLKLNLRIKTKIRKLKIF